MSLKGTLQTPHIPQNKYELTVIGLPPLVFTAISGIEEEVEEVILPDRTAASAGESAPVEFTVTQPMHHALEVAAMEAWYQEGKDPVSPNYKKSGTLIHFNIEGAAVMSWTLIGMWVKRRATSDLEMESTGDMATIERTCRADQVIPTPAVG